MKILMMEGNPISVQDKAKAIGVASASECYIKAIRLFNHDIEIDIVNAADGEQCPIGKSFDDYDAMVISGSSLRAFDTTPEVSRQIQLLKMFGETGKPILGSCWGLQIAAIAAGGKVGPSENGREIGIARKIILTEAGKSHPFMVNKPLAFDAPCIHYDEVTQLPESATLLCGNTHSHVQAAVIPVGKSELWGVQYHPEFELSDLRLLQTLYKRDMLNQGFVRDEQDHLELINKYQNLENNKDNKALAWQLGIDNDILDAKVRAAEINNWLNYITK